MRSACIQATASSSCATRVCVLHDPMRRSSDKAIERDVHPRPLACDAGSAIAPPLMSLAMPDSAARLSVLDFQGEMSVAARNRIALQDVVEGLRLRPLAWSLGWLDIRLRYRGSILGPFWLTLSTAIMIGSLGV